MSYAADNIAAEYLVAESSASIDSTNTDYAYFDERAVVLKKYLESKNSPLAIYSKDFVLYADKYELDYRLVPAITGVESSFGKRIPMNSYNAYGWANGKYKFENWEESIEIVSKTLKEKYIDKGATSIEAIGRIYAPPSPTWSGKIHYFMNQMDPMPIEYTL